MRCVVLQPSYLPWRGHFHQFSLADVVVFYDDVQFDKGGWRNRNRILTPNGPQWLTIPVHHKHHLRDNLTIREIRTVSNSAWSRKHLQAIRQSYGQAPFFDFYSDVLTELYSEPSELLADFTIKSTQWMCEALNIGPTQFIRSSELGITGTKTGRLVEICKHLGADRYLTGPSALDYLDTAAFAAESIDVEVMHYNYGSYPQLHSPFEAQVSCLDLLLMTGPRALSHILTNDSHSSVPVPLETPSL